MAPPVPIGSMQFIGARKQREGYAESLLGEKESLPSAGSTLRNPCGWLWLAGSDQTWLTDGNNFLPNSEFISTKSI